MQLAYFLRLCWCSLSQSLSSSTEKKPEGLGLAVLHVFSAAAAALFVLLSYSYLGENGRLAQARIQHLIELERISAKTVK